MTSQPGEYHGPALEQVRRVQEALPGLQVDFPRANTALREVGQQIVGHLSSGHLPADRPPVEMVCLIPDHQQCVEEIRQILRQKAPQVVAPHLEKIGTDPFQVFHLLVLLFTRRLHLGDVLLHVLGREGEHPAPAPRPELVATVGWLNVVRIQHAIVRQTVRWLIGLRNHRFRRIEDHRLPVHLGWTTTPNEHLLDDLLAARTPLYLYQVFELLLFLKVSIRTFVRHLYLVEAATVGTSHEHLRHLEREEAR